MQEVQEEFLLLKVALQEMARHPIAGKSVYDALTNRENDVRWCIVPPGAIGDKVAAAYDDKEKVMILTKGSGEKAFVHEGFHAVQFLNGVDLHSLSTRDNAITFLLLEASAVAHSFVYYKEREATDPAAYQNFKASEYSMFVGASFDKAYDHFMATSHISDDRQRKKKALEAAGQAVVRSLLAGECREWTVFYAGRISFRMRSHPEAFPPQDAAYLRKRRFIFNTTGYISPDINLTPPELQADVTDKQLDDLAKKTGFRLAPRRPAPQRQP